MGQMTLRLPEPMHARLALLAFTSNEHMSDIVRAALQQYLDERNVPVDGKPR